jgi:hypothetical protein
MQPTGNPHWDGAFGALANAFGSDPSKPAEALYYGSKAREAQLGSNKIIDEQNWRSRFAQGVYNRDDPGATAAPAAPTFYTPTNVPGAAPIVAPPSNLPLSQTVAPTMTPGQAADQVTATLAKNAPRLTQGTPPPMSPPSAVSPPAPTTTTTNGQSPNNDTVSGVFHPESLNTTGGGQQYAAKAQANGSPAQIPFNLGTFSSTGALAGFNAQQMDQMGAATLASLFQKGVIDENMYHQMLAGAGSTAFGVQDSAAKTSITTTGMNNATTLATTGMNNATTLADRKLAEAAATQRYGMDMQFVVNPNDPTGRTGYWTPRGKLQAGQTPAMNPQASAEAVKPIVTQPGGPGTPTQSMPTGQAQQDKTQLYETGPNTYDNFVGKDGLTHIMTAGEAAKQGLGKAPTGTDPELAGRLDAINREPNQDTKRQMLETLIDQQNRAMPLKPPDEDAANQREFLLNQELNARIPPPSGFNTGQNENPAGPSTELGPPQSKLAADYFNRGPPGVKGNAVEAAKAAVSQLVQQGYVDLHQSRARGGVGWSDAATTILRPNYTKEGKPLPEPQKFFRVDLLNPNTGLPYVDPVTGKPMIDPATGKAPIDKRTGKPTTETKPPTEIPMLHQSMSSAMPLGDATGVPDGATATMGGKAVVARGGSWYAQ